MHRKKTCQFCGRKVVHGRLVVDIVVFFEIMGDEGRRFAGGAKQVGGEVGTLEGIDLASEIDGKSELAGGITGRRNVSAASFSSEGSVANFFLRRTLYFLRSTSDLKAFFFLFYLYPC